MFSPRPAITNQAVHIYDFLFKYDQTNQSYQNSAASYFTPAPKATVSNEYSKTLSQSSAMMRTPSAQLRKRSISEVIRPESVIASPFKQRVVWTKESERMLLAIQKSTPRLPYGANDWISISAKLNARCPTFLKSVESCRNKFKALTNNTRSQSTPLSDVVVDPDESVMSQTESESMNISHAIDSENQDMTVQMEEVEDDNIPSYNQGISHDTTSEIMSIVLPQPPTTKYTVAEKAISKIVESKRAVITGNGKSINWDSYHRAWIFEAKKMKYQDPSAEVYNRSSKSLQQRHKDMLKASKNRKSPTLDDNETPSQQQYENE